MSDFVDPTNREELLQMMDESWNELQTFIERLSEKELTIPTDPAGWTVKDHLIHIAAWVQAGRHLLDGVSKRETLDIPQEIWDQDDDPINAVLQERYKDMPLDEVKQILQQRHEEMLQKVATMSDDALQLPYNHYQPSASWEAPIMMVINIDTTEHYREHIPWMQAIVSG